MDAKEIKELQDQVEAEYSTLMGKIHAEMAKAQAEKNKKLEAISIVASLQNINQERPEGETVSTPEGKDHAHSQAPLFTAPAAVRARSDSSYVEEAVDNLSGLWTLRDVRNYIDAKFPGKEISRNSESFALKKLQKNGSIKAVEPKSGTRPAKYQKVAELCSGSENTEGVKDHGLGLLS